MLFSFDRAFDFGRSATPRRRALWDEILSEMKEHGVEKHQVFFLDGGKKTYVPESSRLVQEFFWIYADDVPWDECTVLHDGGNAFKNGKVSIFNHLEHVNCRDHIVYPGPVHQVLSVNDNHCHGIAKGDWRAQRISAKNHIKLSLYLVGALGRIAQGDVVKMWERNFVWDEEVPTEGRCMDLVTNGDFAKVETNEFLSSCFDEYKVFSSRYPSRRGFVQPSAPLSLGDAPDGIYWNEWGGDFS